MSNSTERVRQGAYTAFATENMHGGADTAVEPNWRKRLDALVRGECSEDDFMEEVSAYSAAVPDSAWNVVALLDQHYRRGQVPAELFKSIESKIARRELRVPTPKRTAPRYPVDFRALRVRAGLTQRLEPAPPRLADAHATVATDAPEPAPAARAAATPLLYRLTARAEPPTLTEDAAQSAAGAVPAPVPATDDEPVAANTVAELAVGQVLRDRYVIESRLDSGGMGIVYKAVDRVRREHGEVDSYVAIKILHDSARRKRSALAKLRREFYCAQTLSHRSIVKVFDLDRDHDLDFFSMEYLSGKPLSVLMQECHPQPIARERAWSVIREIGAGLAHAHTRNIVHADLKPQNVMLLDSGDLRILDFGASSGLVRHSPQLDGATAVAGKPSGLTPAYASCELLEGQAADPRDDLFALACLACELLAGRHPFDYLRATEARKFDLKAQRPAGLTNRQWHALESGLAWVREQRAPNVRDWVAELLPRPSPWAFIPRARDFLDARLAHENAGAHLVGALVVVVAGLATVALTHRPQPNPNAEVAALAKPAATSDVAVPAAIAPAVTVLSAARPSAAQRVSPDVGPVVMSPPVIMTPGAAAPAATAAATPTVAAAVSTVPTPSASQAAPLPAPATAPVSARPAAADTRAEGISMTTAIYRVPANAKYVEVRVRRSAATGENANFVWWTQDGTATAGTDFVPQGRTTVTFTPNKPTATLFVKLVPDAARQRAAAFSVMIGEAPGGAALGAVTKSSIVLAPR